jgi:hypothetical protein
MKGTTYDIALCLGVQLEGLVTAEVASPDRDRCRLIVDHGSIRSIQARRVRDSMSTQECAQHCLYAVTGLEGIAGVDMGPGVLKIEVVKRQGSNDRGRVGGAVGRGDVEVGCNRVVRILLSARLLRGRVSTGKRRVISVTSSLRRHGAGVWQGRA